MKSRPHVLHLDALPQGVLLYSKPQMAAALQVSVRCLSGMMRRGEISYFKIHGRIVRFLPVAALRRLIETSLLIDGVSGPEAISEGRWLKAEHLTPALCGGDGKTSSALGQPSPRPGPQCGDATISSGESPKVTRESRVLPPTHTQHETHRIRH